MTPAWMERARCLDADPELFFPAKGGSADPAKAVCAACPVRVPCLDYALDHGERLGVWGGTTPRERRELRRSVRALRRSLRTPIEAGS